MFVTFVKKDIVVTIFYLHHWHKETHYVKMKCMCILLFFFPDVYAGAFCIGILPAVYLNKK